MKPLHERQIYVDYMGGKPIPAHDFNNGGLDIFSNYVYPDVLREHAGRQLDFEGEIWYTKSRPIQVMSPEQEYLLRHPTPEEQRIQVIRTELKTYES